MEDYGLCVCLDIGVVFVCLVFIYCVCLYNGVPQYINTYTTNNPPLCSDEGLTLETSAFQNSLRRLIVNFNLITNIMPVS